MKAMSYQVEWWIGPAGSGKSARIAEEMRLAVETNPLGAPIFWVVPESTAFAAETLLMERVRSAFRAEVVTLRRLADRVCAHGGTARPRLTQVGRQLLLRTAYDQLAPELGPLRRAVRSGALYQHVLSAFDELTAHRVSPEQLAALLEMSAARSAEVEARQRAVHSSLVGKLGDVLKLYVRYRRLADEAGLADPSLLFHDAVEAAPHVTWLEQATLYVDGFHAFTPAERAFLASLAHQAKRLVITWDEIGLEGGEWGELFEAAASTAAWPHLSAWLDAYEERFPSELQAVAAYHLLECARDFARAELRQAFCRLPDGAGEGRFSHTPLAHFERALCGYEPEAEIRGVRIQRFGDRAEELNAVADEIAHLVHHERVRPRDIAVCVPTLDDLGRRLAGELELRGVPVSIDLFTSLADHPVGQLLRGAVGAARTGFDLDAIAALIRCPLVPVKRREAFDLYIREHGVTGSEPWLSDEPWTFASRAPRSQSGMQDAEAEEIRRGLVNALRPVLEAFSGPTLRPARAARTLWELMQAFGVKDALAQSVVQVGGDPMAGVIDEQAWSAVTALLDDLASIQPDAELPSGEVADLVREALEGVSLTRIPGDADCVFVCDFARADNWSRRRVFVLAADDASLPPRVGRSGILRDDERLAFAEVFLRPLGRTSEDEQRALQCLPYRVMTRASEALVVTCATSEGGIERHLTPMLASLVERGHLGIDEVRGEASIPVHPTQAMRILADALSRVHTGVPLEAVAKDPVVQDILTYIFGGENADRERFLRVLAGACHRPQAWKLPADWVRRLYGDPVRVSVSRLETYARCPYQHFARYALGLRPLELEPVAEREAGTWIHAAVQAVTRRLAEAYDGLAALDDAMRDRALRDIAEKALADAAVETRLAAVLARPDVAVYADERRRHFGFVVRFLWMQLDRGQMRPFWLEREFRDAEIGEWNGVRVVMDGRIDRVDRLQQGELALCVYDYKSSETSLHPSKVYEGLQLQLLIYASVAMRELEAAEGGPARLYGVFYVPLAVRWDALDAPPAVSDASSQLAAYQAKGYFLRDPSAVVRVNEDLAPGRKAVLYKQQFVQSGDWAKRATAWREDEWQVVLDHVQRRAKEAAQAIAEGEVRVSPYHLSHEDSGCTNCPYNALCHFERADHFDLYRPLRKLSFDDVIAGGGASS